VKAIRLNKLLEFSQLKSKSTAYFHKRNSALVNPALKSGRGNGKKLSRVAYSDQPAFGSGLHFYAASSVFSENGRSVGLGVFVGKGPSEKRRNAERLEGAGSDGAAGKFVAAVTVVKTNFTINEAEHVLEGVVLLLEIHESRSGKTPSTELIGRENDEGGEALAFLYG